MSGALRVLAVDRDLVEAARGGDREAYVDLIRPRFGRLFVIALRILRDVDRAEDALQDTLVIASRDLRGLRDPDRFDALNGRILVHQCTDQASRGPGACGLDRVHAVTHGPRPAAGSLSRGSRASPALARSGRALGITVGGSFPPATFNAHGAPSA